MAVATATAAQERVAARRRPERRACIVEYLNPGYRK
jgi:hypothetical protein